MDPRHTQIVHSHTQMRGGEKVLTDALIQYFCSIRIVKISCHGGPENQECRLNGTAANEIFTTAPGLFFNVFSLLGGILFRRVSSQDLHHNQHPGHQSHTRWEGDPGGLSEAGYDVGDKGHSRRCDGIRELGHYMVYVLALCSGGCHDGGVGDGRAVVAADSSGHARGDGDDHKLGIAVFKHSNHNGDQNPEGAPGGSGGKGQETAYNKDNGWKEI